MEFNKNLDNGEPLTVDHLHRGVLRGVNEHLREGYGLHSAFSLLNRTLEGVLDQLKRIEEKLDKED